MISSPVRTYNASGMGSRLVYVLYCIEAGFFFVMVPWTRFWINHPFLNSTPSLAALAINPYFRGFVSGFGMVHLLVGIRELVSIIETHRDQAGRRR
ncbi:MAG: hypothetical protein ABI718_13645 [Acidobacteriota bacterium]